MMMVTLIIMTLPRVQVLHQGWLLTPANLESFLSTIISGIQRLEEHVSRIAACVIDELGEFTFTLSCYDLFHLSYTIATSHR